MYLGFWLWEVRSVGFYEGLRVWEAPFVVFYEGLRLWEAHLYVFYVSGRLSGGSVSNGPKNQGGSAKEKTLTGVGGGWGRGLVGIIMSSND